MIPEQLREGETGHLLFSGTEVKILGTESDTSSHTMYQVQFNDGRKMLANLDEVAKANDPFYLFVQECKLYMEDLGYRALALGTDKNFQWMPFYFNEPEEYNKLVQKNRDIRFRYYWALNR